MEPQFDAVVGGGSVAGLVFAAEAAKRGISVLVVEEHPSIGEPEKCDGLVSLRGLRRYGFAPKKDVIQNQIASGVIHSPGGRELAVNATPLEVFVLDRSAYDQQLAEGASNWGARFRLGTRVEGVSEKEGAVRVKVGGDTVTARYYVDATGPSSAPREGILPAAKYEIEEDWTYGQVVEVFLDAEKYPGFFAWAIPRGNGMAKVGAAGRGINAFAALDGFLSSRKQTVLKRVAAPIYVGGPTERFVVGRRVLVGESAGMVKPTTAGGIVTSVVGGVLAARWTSDSVQLKDPSLLSNYQPDWESRYGKEMRAMLRLRGVFEKLTNRELDGLVEALSSKRVAAKLGAGDFDLHATALLGALGVGGLLRLTSIIASSEARALLSGQ